MGRRDYLQISLVATLVALALMVVIVVMAFSASPPVGQELFETIGDPAGYAAKMAAGDAVLRRILFVDGLFMLAYTVAVGFTLLAFADNNRAAALAGGIGIVVVMLLDGLENAVMAQSLDIVAVTGAVTLERVALQASVSAMKWQGAAATLLAVSFVLPSTTAVEKLLVWGVRLGLPIAVPLFVIGAFGLREIAGLLLLGAMASGFALLAIVLRGRMNRS